MLLRLYTYLHAHVGITHAAIDGQFRQTLATVHCHGVEDSLCLETSCFHGCTGNVPFLCVGGDTPWETLAKESWRRGEVNLQIVPWASSIQ